MASANARIIRKVRRGKGRGTPVRSFKSFLPTSVEAIIAGKADQLRVLAEASADVLIDRIFGQKSSGNITARKPKPKSKKGGVGIGRAPFRFKKLNRRYAAFKKKAGLDGRILLATGDYVSGIEIHRSKTKGAGITYRVRMKPRRHKSGFTYAQLAALHEFGSARINLPSRPHWRPVGADVLRAAKRLKVTATAEEIRQAVRKIR